MKTHILPILLLCAGIACAAFTNAAEVNYTADNTTIFPNPERGFIFLLEAKKTSKYPYHAVKGKESYLTNHKNDDKGSMVLVEYFLNEFRNAEVLPDSVLNAFDEDMSVLRTYGMKCVVRFAYTYSDAGDIGYDAPLAIIQKHLAQYKSHWQENADVVFCFEAGFIGSWGEWYYTENFGNKGSHMNDLRAAFLDTLLNTVPEDRMIQVRTPRFKEEYISGNYSGGTTPALTEEEAFTGTPKARLGHHNDAFLHDDKDQGTYADTARQKNYIAQETLYVPIGGESNIDNDSVAAVRATREKTIAEMSRLHWTFIQGKFTTLVTNMWHANGTFDELNQKLGYRYQLISGTYSEALEPNEKLSVSLQVRNVGFAPLYNERPAYIVLKNASKSYPLRLDADPRRWKPNGVVSTINEQLPLPDGIESGTYQLYLYLPDAYESIADDPRYAVRFANTGVWDAETGMNRLNATVTISGGITPPDPEDTSVPLPATLNKDNHSTHSDDTWYGENDEYFDFQSGGGNLSRWIEWKVELTTPGKYTVSEITYCANGHNYALELWQGSDSITTFLTAQTWATGDLNITQDAKWNLANIPAGTYTLRVKNAMKDGSPKLKSLTINFFGAVSSDTINLPATLDKNNLADFSDKIGWYNTDYIDFGVKDANNTDHTADWRVNLLYPGNYIVSTVGDYPNGHQWQIQLLNSSASVYTLTRTSATGEYTETGTDNWNLSSVPAGVYILRINNIYAYGRPKLKSLTLEYDGEMPTAIDSERADKPTGEMYDLLGRRVGEGYKGIVICNGQKILIQ